MHRRDFIHGALGLTGWWAIRPPTGRAQSSAVLFRQGLIIDGSGTPALEADLLVRDGRVAAIGQHLDDSSAETVDCRDRVVCPGFIDIHSHTDLDLFIEPLAESKVRQGVTTEVAGQDGSSVGPWSAERASMIRERYSRRYGVELPFADLGGFFAHVEGRGTAVNLASMVGHGQPWAAMRSHGQAC